MTEPPFRVEKATIEALHGAIRAGRTTCVDVVQQYLARVRAYNGVCSMLMTANGAPCRRPPAPFEVVRHSAFLVKRCRHRRLYRIWTATPGRRSSSGEWSRPGRTPPYISNTA